MKSSFHPRLINGPFDDPGLFVPFFFEKRAFLFDLGEIEGLVPRDVLKISHVFISHTHMDHFIGFDRLLRLFLGRGKPIFIYGPEGFLDNLEGRLSSYTWNLVQHYQEEFVIHAMEVREDRWFKRKYPCKNRFQPVDEVVESRFQPVLLEEPALKVTTAILNHSIPCLGFAVQERFHINIKKDVLLEMGFTVGPWLGRLKNAIYAGRPLDATVEVPAGENGRVAQTMTLGELTPKIVQITTGQKIVYITDVVYCPENEAKIVALAQHADHLFIEATFLDQDRSDAQNKKHLTAYQAGHMAALAGVKRFSLFHFSPRYKGYEHSLQQEALDAFNQTAGRSVIS